MVFHIQQLFYIFVITSTFCAATQESPEKNTQDFCHDQRRLKITDPIEKPSMITTNNSLRSNLNDTHDVFCKHGLSYHITIEKNGVPYATIGSKPIEILKINGKYLIDPALIAKRSWSTGVGYWNGEKQEINNINTHAINILFVNEGTNNNNNPNPVLGDSTSTTIWYPHTDEQLTTFAQLILQLKEEYNIADKDVVGYGQVRINQKTDALDFAFNPGPIFWQKAMERDIVTRPTLTQEEKNQYCNEHIQDFQRTLHDLGYYVKITGENDRQTQAATKQLRVRFDAYTDNPQDPTNPYDTCVSYNIARNLISQITAKKITKQNDASK